MTRIALPALLIAAAVLAACAADPSPSARQPSPALMIAEGTVTQINPTHGNLYTSIAPDRYESLGLEPGDRIHVAFDDTALTMEVGRDYTDVPTGTPLAVLHREGLTFAIRDGDFSDTYNIALGAPFTISAAPAGE
ncbi:MAG: SAM hydroxide adenosyltransferase [Phycisphaeraceae bacterium]